MADVQRAPPWKPGLLCPLQLNPRVSTTSGSWAHALQRNEGSGHQETRVSLFLALSRVTARSGLQLRDRVNKWWCDHAVGQYTAVNKDCPRQGRLTDTTLRERGRSQPACCVIPSAGSSGTRGAGVPPGAAPRSQDRELMGGW